MKTSPIQVCIETGTKRVFAAAIDWPGYARSGRDEASALQALVEYGERYAQAIQADGVPPFESPDEPGSLVIVERVAGTKTTDFGAPDISLAGDADHVSAQNLERSLRILEAAWDTLLRQVERAGGKPLQKGPRGGGREVNEILQHVVEAQLAYLERIGASGRPDGQLSEADLVQWMKAATRKALPDLAAGLVPSVGPRGGKRWNAPYFIRRSAWHILDHAWEIEDRAV